MNAPGTIRWAVHRTARTHTLTTTQPPDPTLDVWDKDHDLSYEEPRYEVEVNPPDGDPRLHKAHLTLRPFEERFRGTVGIIRGVTECKDRE